MKIREDQLVFNRYMGNIENINLDKFMSKTIAGGGSVRGTGTGFVGEQIGGRGTTYGGDVYSFTVISNPTQDTDCDVHFKIVDDYKNVVGDGNVNCDPNIGL